MSRPRSGEKGPGKSKEATAPHRRPHRSDKGRAERRIEKALPPNNAEKVNNANKARFVKEVMLDRATIIMGRTARAAFTAQATPFSGDRDTSTDTATPGTMATDTPTVSVSPPPMATVITMMAGTAAVEAVCLVDGVVDGPATPT